MRLQFWKPREDAPTHADAVKALHALEHQQKAINEYDASPNRDFKQTGSWGPDLNQNG
jgi:hypothetical protein